MAEEVSSKPLRKVLQQVVEDIRQGSSISAALAKHELVFPPIYQSMIQVGERTGNLGSVLRQLSIHLEKESNIKSKIKGAMTYPGVVLAMAFGVILLLLNFTLPPLLALYSEFDAQLPWPTRFLMNVTESFLQYRIHLLVGFVLLLAAWIFLFSKQKGKETTSPSGIKVTRSWPDQYLRQQCPLQPDPGNAYQCRLTANIIHGAHR